ncbi:MAG TPA: hypothetical protein PLJ27_13995 [Polyangiaceae bacterium]|jgi:hypothetical protein|nr:MAG: hypothetical protein BWY17_03305 [Deltaproteobacteria bacterium ADurb.Bin207]HNS99460.1 hypothetical protein [Polyangiaceae bacterium]HNZ23734.1 hypothetical protein [Polyangiaceae bacterium]HOD24884.1 hypothetical protein [Polyangiaceae bacterium]HOE48959.1 hypothetical protein [Polyangiaceae bacterium]
MTDDLDLSKPSATTRLAEKARHRIHLRGVIRVLAYCFVVSVVLGGLSIRSAWGNFKDSALIVGRQFASFGDLEGRIHRVRLNGEPVLVTSAVTTASMDDVLGRFEALCRQDAGGLDKIFETLPANLKEEFETADGAAGVGIVRNQAGPEGMVACLSQQPLEGWQSLPSRIEKFLSTGDLTHIGDLRYVYTKQMDGRTHVITVWTEGSFNLFNVAPMDGQEAPGSDSPNAPRPEEAVRLLSATVEGAPYAVRIYDSAKPQQEVLAMYDSQMPSRGWSPIPHATDDVAHGRAYTREGVDLLIFAFEQKDRSYVSVVEMSPR